MKIIFRLLFLVLPAASFAQSPYFTLNQDIYSFANKMEVKFYQNNTHLFIRPVNKNSIQALIDSLKEDTLKLSKIDLYQISKIRNIKSKKPVLKWFYKHQKDFYSVTNNEFELHINPVLNLQRGTEKSDTASFSTYINTRGIELQGLIGKKIGFYAFMTENQVLFPSYTTLKIEQEQALPGEGYYKWFKDKYRSYDFFTANGYITFNPYKFVNIQFGHGKNFLGDGYRSLVLSDFSNNYLFLKINTRVWKINYQNIFAELASDHVSSLLIGDGLIDKKYLAIHHLSYNLNKNVNIGIFETVTFGRNDTTKAQHFELNYLNPLIFFRSIEHAIGSPDNVMMGTNLKVNFAKHFSVYSQFVLDDFNVSEFKKNRNYWGSKFAWQLGLKYFDVAGIDDLNFYGELNIARPYTYTHVYKDANYTHYNQPLAHPLGANFMEIITGINYKPFKKITFSSQLFLIQKGVDSDSSNWGGNIFLKNTHGNIPENNTRFLQGNLNKIIFTDISIEYEWKPNIYFDLNFINRNINSFLFGKNSSNLITAGFRMNVGKRKLEF